MRKGEARKWRGGNNIRHDRRKFPRAQDISQLKVLRKMDDLKKKKKTPTTSRHILMRRGRNTVSRGKPTVKK